MAASPQLVTMAVQNSAATAEGDTFASPIRRPAIRTAVMKIVLQNRRVAATRQVAMSLARSSSKSA